MLVVKDLIYVFCEALRGVELFSSGSWETSLSSAETHLVGLHSQEQTENAWRFIIYNV